MNSSHSYLSHEQFESEFNLLFPTYKDYKEEEEVTGELKMYLEESLVFSFLSLPDPLDFSLQRLMHN